MWKLCKENFKIEAHARDSEGFFTEGNGRDDAWGYGRDFRSAGAAATRHPIFIRTFEEIFTMTHLVLLLLGSLGTTEIVLILLIVVLMFGGRKIPELMRGLGKGIREFNDAKNNVKREIEDGIKEDQNDRNPR